MRIGIVRGRYVYGKDGDEDRDKRLRIARRDVRDKQPPPEGRSHCGADWRDSIAWGEGNREGWGTVAVVERLT